jgi:uncharacterized tellurite resistance protein B-like protein
MLFEKLARLVARPPAATPDPMRRHLAMAVLLAETARADFTDQAGERDTMRGLLVSALGLPVAEAAALVERAFDRSRAAISLHDFLATLNGELDAGAKTQLLEWLWRVAFADGRLDPQEEARVRQIADWLFVPHSDFIRMKLKVADELSVPG